MLAKGHKWMWPALLMGIDMDHGMIFGSQKYSSLTVRAYSY